MTPTQARASLDRSLAQAGQDATLQRLLGTSLVPVGVTVRVNIQGYKPHEIIAGSGLQAGDSHVILSTTQINAAQWPGATPPSPGDRRVPRNGDRLIASRKVRVVIAAWEATRIMSGAEAALPDDDPDKPGELVRIEMSVR